MPDLRPRHAPVRGRAQQRSGLRPGRLGVARSLLPNLARLPAAHGQLRRELSSEPHAEFRDVEQDVARPRHTTVRLLRVLRDWIADIPGPAGSELHGRLTVHDGILHEMPPTYLRRLRPRPRAHDHGERHASRLPRRRCSPRFDPGQRLLRPAAFQRRRGLESGHPGTGSRQHPRTDDHAALKAALQATAASGRVGQARGRRASNSAAMRSSFSSSSRVSKSPNPMIPMFA